ncbi:WXG100 family type VII secretion target [Dactylosporangium sp. CS-047395]|uniref:WXG100 family type VII secretion target n=1 Tax=Dactylosporangium sp. CS-047395 TaxID=3239936 RepID=UPI003D8E189F
MADQYYGYVKYTLPPSVSHYDNYDPSKQIVDYTPTPWDAETTTIELMWPWIQIDSDARATALADMWRRVHTLLDNTGRNLRRYTDELAATWSSDASQVFLREIGASLSSIDEWKEVAHTNATGLDVLASTIKYNQRRALAVWNEYVAAIKNPGSVPGSEQSQSNVTTGKAGGYSIVESEDARKQRLVKHYTEQIKPYVKDLADTYLNVYFNFLTHGSRYKGPTNAAVAVPPTFSGGGGPAGHIPPPPLLRPPALVPPSPALPPGSVTGMPGLPDDHLILAGGVVAPPVPSVVPPVVPPVVPTLPPVLGMPFLPGVGAVPGMPGGPTGLDPAAGTQRLGPGGMRPNLSGLRPAPPDAGAPRPPMPPMGGNPNLRGSKGRRPGAVHGPNVAEEMPRPGVQRTPPAPRPPVPPRLGGQRGQAGRSGSAGPSGHVGPEGERMGGRGAGERLAGRRGGGVSPLPRGDSASDEGLWAVERPRGVIDRPGLAEG